MRSKSANFSLPFVLRSSTAERMPTAKFMHWPLNLLDYCRRESRRVAGWVAGVAGTIKFMMNNLVNPCSSKYMIIYGGFMMLNNYGVDRSLTFVRKQHQVKEDGPSPHVCRRLSRCCRQCHHIGPLGCRRTMTIRDAVQDIVTSNIAI